MNNVSLSLISAAGMMLVAAAAVIYWRRVSKLRFKWFWLGAALWAVAVALKFVCALLTNPAVIGFFQKNLVYPLYVLGGGLYLGIQSSLFEVGLTLLAVLLWRQLGRDADRAIGIGLGAGAFEAIMLGLAGLGGALVYYTGLPGAEQVKGGTRRRGGGHAAFLARRSGGKGDCHPLSCGIARPGPVGDGETQGGHGCLGLPALHPARCRGGRLADLGQDRADLALVD